MQVNVLEAKSQLSKLVKAALEGEEVIIARDGEPMVKLVPLSQPRKLGGWGRLKRFAGDIDGAFTPEGDAEIRRMVEDDP
jgi:prevent-host-death family protein